MRKPTPSSIRPSYVKPIRNWVTATTAINADLLTAGMNWSNCQSIGSSGREDAMDIGERVIVATGSDANLGTMRINIKINLFCK